MKTKNYMKKLIIILLVLTSSWASVSQCSHTPTITNPHLGEIFTGSIFFCGPNDTQVLSTQNYDSYQWYKQQMHWDVPNPNPWIAVNGATSQTLTLNGYFDFGYSFKVAATLDGCTEESPEVFMDGYTYALPVMESVFVENTYSVDFDQNGLPFYQVCTGSSVTLKNLFPVVYGTHTWYKCMPNSIPPITSDPCIIVGETGDQITVTDSGIYGFYACTEYCPNMCEIINGFINIQFGNYGFCTLGNEEPIKENALTIYPNPTYNYLFIGKINEIYKEVNIIDMAGKIVLKIDNHKYQTPINITQLSAGTYLIISITDDGRNYRNKFIKE